MSFTSVSHGLDIVIVVVPKKGQLKSSFYILQPCVRDGCGIFSTDDTNLIRSVSSVEHGDDHPGPGESVPQGDSPKGPYIKYVTGKHQEVWTIKFICNN